MIIAEVSTNYRNLDEARQLIRLAKDNGAGLVKFQLFDPEEDKGKPHYEWVKDHALDYGQAKTLFDYGESIGIEVFFSVFGVQYVEWCERIGVKRYKLACTFREETTVKTVLETRKPFFISTDDLWDNNILGKFVVRAHWLYCVPDYPALNVRLPDFQETSLDGFSDHTIGLDAAKIALARGAQIIEKHFILDRSIPAPDAPWSMTPPELAELVRFEKVVRECL